jgi:hypothetical protein
MARFGLPIILTHCESISVFGYVQGPGQAKEKNLKNALESISAS